MNLLSNLKSIILNRRTLFAAVILILIAEALWAVQTLNLTSKSPVGSQATNQNVSKAATEISLRTVKSQLKVGEETTVEIYLNSTKMTDGTDLIIKYDPTKLSLVPKSATEAVSTGTIYSDYPVNMIDAKNNQIIVSGISSKENGVQASGLFGSLVFQAKATGISDLTIDFSPGKTTESNVIETKTAKDVLEKVVNLKIEVTK